MKNLILALSLLLPISAYVQSVTNLPLFQIENLEYTGAFRVPSDEYGASSINYAEGPMAYNPINHSLYLVGHNHEQAIAEFAIPELVSTDSLSLLNFAAEPLQAFSSVLGKVDNPQNLNRIGGMYYLQNGSEEVLVVNAYEYYDAPADNSQTTLILEDANDIKNSSARGFLTFNGGAGHTSGWISPIPLEWKEVLSNDYITGQSSGIPIISRTSVGPSLFTFNMEELIDASEDIPTEKLLDFSLADPLHEDLDNSTGNNGIWTHLSRAVYGFIVPGTRTYLTVGYSGGHLSGVCYKCTQNNGNLCGGYCPPDSSDYSQYYWLWDMNDLLEVKQGLRSAYEVSPYDYGPFHTPFQNDVQKINGGVYDPIDGTLYLSIKYADAEQGTYRNPPVVVAYSIDQVTSLDILVGDEDITLFPNPTSEIFTIKGLTDEYLIQIIDSTGSVYDELESQSATVNINIENLPDGLYFVQVLNQSNNQMVLRKILKQ